MLLWTTISTKPEVWSFTVWGSYQPLRNFIPCQISQILDKLRQITGSRLNPLITLIPRGSSHHLWNLQGRSWKVPHLNRLHTFTKYSIMVFFPTKILVEIWSILVLYKSSLSKLHPGQAAHSSLWMLDSKLHHIHSKSSTRLRNHSIYVFVLYSPVQTTERHLS